MTTAPHVPRPEHPNPQFYRERWLNLNGRWDFELDLSESGFERNIPAARQLSGSIMVPFCPESELSGIGYVDFIPSCWYQRLIEIPTDWEECMVLLHIGASDYRTRIFLDGKLVGEHYGGSAPFSVNLTPFVHAGESHNLVINVSDSIRSGVQPGGKQSLEYYSAGCFYTRVTGIWQTVWLEAVHPYGLQYVTLRTDISAGRLYVDPRFYRGQRGRTLRVVVSNAEDIVAEASTAGADGAALSVDVRNARLWYPGNPFLYDLRFEVFDEHGKCVDSVSSYAGFREVTVEGNRLFLNREPLYVRFVLDQGFYPQGLWTAPSQLELRADIQRGLDCGFNGARLHQKVFEPLYHYWADRLGYLTWGESASWGMKISNPEAARNFLSEWASVVARDRNHPSIVAWTPLNETWDISVPAAHRRLHVEAYELTRLLDPSRPVNDASGGCHVRTDLYTVHIYEEEPEKLYEKLALDEDGQVFRTLGEQEAEYRGQPYIIAEFGGIRWLHDSRRPFSTRSWGYGNSPVTSREFYERLRGQVEALLALSHCSGYCYTQLTDVEQEENGLFTYDRVLKFDPALLREIFSAEPGKDLAPPSVCS